MSTATFIYMMLVLKLPILALLWIVWWAIRATPEVDTTDEDGGLRQWPHGPRPPHAPRPRRGPHADPPPAAPPRTRTVVAQGRDTQLS
ncbi:MAG: hypothetical protein QOG77_3427 [Solirubrobacteraceae bacterium]|nr:hypothetical protein [Solirubrobacteraceae bacterium]